MGEFRCALTVIVLILPLFLSAAEQKPSIGNVISIARAPDNPRSAWAVSDTGLFRSRDGGSTWNPVQTGLSEGTYASHVWMIGGPAAAVFVSTNKRSLLRSVDDGMSWQFVNHGLPRGIGAEEVTPIVSLASSGAPPLVYVLTEAEGVFRSSSNGMSWDSASSGLPVPFFNRTQGSLLAVHPQNPDRVYAFLDLPATSHHDRLILFASTNGGRSWSPLKEFEEDFRPAAMEVDTFGVLAMHNSDGHTVRVETPAYLGSDTPSMTYLNLVSGGGSGHPVAMAADRDEDGIAILEDDGSLIYREFDLAEKSIEFRPSSDGTYGIVSAGPQFEPASGEKIDLGDDDSRSVPLPFAFPFYAKTWKTLYVNSNGSVSFEKGDRSGFFQVSSFFTGSPRIAPFWTDLDPSSAGEILVLAESARVVVTWNAVPLWRQTAPNTYQVVLFADGRIRFNYGVVNSKSGITGISNGFQKDGDYVVFSNLSRWNGQRSMPILQLFRTPDIDPIRASLRFYQTHDDDFDQLVYFAAGSYPATVAGGGGAYFARVKNEVRGIGVSLADFASQLGSAGRLRGVINMNSLSQYPDRVTDSLAGDPSSATAVTILGQEALHRFGAFVRFRDGRSASNALLGRQLAHWSYFLNSEGSVMEGNDWVDNDAEASRRPELL